MGKTPRTLIVLLLLTLSFTFTFTQKIFAADFEDYYSDELQDVDTEAPASQPENVTLNADRVSFNDETGHAFAEGNAVLTYNDTTIMAERIEYDAGTQQVQAMPLPGQQVLLSNGTRTITGDNLNYDLNTQEGILTGAGTHLPVGDAGGMMYIYGSEIDVIPWEIAQERGLVKGTPEEYIIEWRNVIMTTCALEHPHYRLESKTISFIPGRSVTAHKPRIYFGNTYLFTSPLDYVVQLKRKMKYSFMPYYRDSDTKGAGGGFTGTIGWATGQASLGMAWFEKAGWEFMGEVEQKLNDDFTILVGTEHSWDDLWNDRVWRPYSSLIYSHNGWDARLNWSRNEYISDQKDSTHDYKGRLDRRPEFIGWFPWFKSSLYSWARFHVTYGNYKETMHNERENGGENTSRYGVGFRNYYERPAGKVEFFSDASGVSWFYDREDADHEMLRIFTGLRYKIGAFEMGTGYERQYTWGESAMHWDQYSNRERFHQKIRFLLSGEFYFMMRGSYDLNESMIDEVYYALQWITDCMTWDLHYKDNKMSGGEDEIGLSLSLNAFPNAGASFGQRLDTDPFLRPADVPKK